MSSICPKKTVVIPDSIAAVCSHSTFKWKKYAPPLKWVLSSHQATFGAIRSYLPWCLCWGTVFFSFSKTEQHYRESLSGKCGFNFDPSTIL